MLRSLAIRNVVLIDRLDLTFQDGLSVLTGETGAGKSILLDALGLALGARADAALVRHGTERAQVTAAFEIAPDHPAHTLLTEHGLDDDAGGEADTDALVLRRLLGRDGRSRAFVNDQPASVGLLRRLGAVLVEIEGQFAEQGLLDAGTHRQTLDAFGGLKATAADTAHAYRAWGAAQRAETEAEGALATLRGEEENLRHALAEIEGLDPRPGEEAALADERALLMHRERLIEALDGAAAELRGREEDAGDGRDVETALRTAQRILERVAEKAAGRLDEVIGALDRAAIEITEAAAQLQALGTTLDHDSTRLDEAEERLFALRAVARKHGVTVDDLADLRDRLAGQLDALEDRGGDLARLARETVAARHAYAAKAEALSHARTTAARTLDAAVTHELPPLKLDKAMFHTRLAPLDEEAWSEHGRERVVFEVTTNPGTPPGPLNRVASGGELARFLLALKVVAARKDPASTLVFDEVDRGIGGAVAAAVGERLARLGESRQVLVVTHSPQVAARAAHHWRIRKKGAAGTAVATVEALAAEARREEIARMLAGAEITDEARAAAARLLQGDGAEAGTAAKAAPQT